MNYAEGHHYLLPNTGPFWSRERIVWKHDYYRVCFGGYGKIQEQNVCLHSFIYINDPMLKQFQYHHCACCIHTSAQGHGFKVRISYWVGYLAHIV